MMRVNSGLLAGAFLPSPRRWCLSTGLRTGPAPEWAFERHSRPFGLQARESTTYRKRVRFALMAVIRRNSNSRGAVLQAVIRGIRGFVTTLSCPGPNNVWQRARSPRSRTHKNPVTFSRMNGGYEPTGASSFNMLTSDSVVSSGPHSSPG